MALLRNYKLFICIFIFLTLGPNGPLDVWGQEEGSPPRPKIGLALSGGGSKGLAHIGVLKVLEELGVQVDMVAGTSMGSIIGGLYAAGYTPGRIEEIVNDINWIDSFSSTPSRRVLRYDQKLEQKQYLLEVGIKDGRLALPTGLLSDYKLLALLTRFCLPVAGIENFDDLPIPFRAVATDILTGNKVVLSEGNLALAMRASMSIPMVFSPYELNGQLLVDGGVVENLPVQTVLDMGADVVIAVNVSSPLKKRDELNSFIDLLDQTTSIQIVKSTTHQLTLADLVIAPEVLSYGTFDFDKSKELIKIGEAAAREVEPKIIEFARKNGVALSGRTIPGAVFVNEIVVEKVTLEGPDAYQADLKRLAPFKPGQRVSTVELDDAMQKLYGLGTLESVIYEVVPTDSGLSEVRFILKEKEAGWRTRLGLRVGFNTERVSQSQLDLSLEKPNLFHVGSYANVKLTLGRNLGLTGKLFVPNRPIDGFYFRPDFYLLSDRYNVYEDGDIKAEYVVDSFGGGLEAGVHMGSFGKFSLRYLLEHVASYPRIATIPLEKSSDRLAGLEVELGVDTLDRSIYPTRGFASAWKYTAIRRELLSHRNYNRITWKGQTAVPLAKNQILSANWDLGTSLNTNPPVSKSMFLGGYPGMLGYAPDEFFGNELARFQLRYRYPLTEAFNLGVAVNTGAVWESLDRVRDGDTRWHWGGGASVGWDSIIGPLEVTVGMGEKRRLHFYVNFGYEF